MRDLFNSEILRLAAKILSIVGFIIYNIKGAEIKSTCYSIPINAFTKDYFQFRLWILFVG